MAAKVNLKKYLAVEGKWQFVPVLKVNGKPEPAVVLIAGEPTKGASGTFYIEWREHANGKRLSQASINRRVMVGLIADKWLAWVRDRYSINS